MQSVPPTYEVSQPQRPHRLVGALVYVLMVFMQKVTPSSHTFTATGNPLTAVLQAYTAQLDLQTPNPARVLFQCTKEYTMQQHPPIKSASRSGPIGWLVPRRMPLSMSSALPTPWRQQQQQ
jgi:hypothetical protein